MKTVFKIRVISAPIEARVAAKLASLAIKSAKSAAFASINAARSTPRAVILAANEVSFANKSTI